jgi:hypothetical protein
VRGPGRLVQERQVDLLEVDLPDLARPGAMERPQDPGRDLGADPARPVAADHDRHPR